MKKISVIGTLLVLLYLAGTAFCWYYARTCSGQYCGYVIVVPVLPWIVLVERFLDHDLAYFAYGLIILFNITLAYFIGHGTGLCLKKLFIKPAPKIQKTRTRT